MEQDLCLSLCVCVFTQIFEKQVVYIKSKFLPYYLTILLFLYLPTTVHENVNKASIAYLLISVKPCNDPKRSLATTE